MTDVSESRVQVCERSIASAVHQIDEWRHRAVAAERDRDALAAALLHGLLQLGFDTDGCADAGKYVGYIAARPGVSKFETFAAEATRSFTEHRLDMEEEGAALDRFERAAASVPLILGEGS